MSPDELRTAIERSRRFSHELAGHRFDLVLPTQFAIDCISAEQKHFPRMQRQMLATSLRGWQQVSVRDLKVDDADLPDEPLAFTPESVELLFNQRPDWESALMEALADRIAARRKALEEQAGN